MVSGRSPLPLTPIPGVGRVEGKVAVRILEAVSGRGVRYVAE
jgi:hypothetical protein